MCYYITVAFINMLLDGKCRPYNYFFDTTSFGGSRASRDDCCLNGSLRNIIYFTEMFILL